MDKRHLNTDENCAIDALLALSEMKHIPNISHSFSTLNNDEKIALDALLSICESDIADDMRLLDNLMRINEKTEVII